MNTILQPVSFHDQIRLRSIQKLLKNHQNLFKFIFENSNGELRAEPDKLLTAAGGFSHGEIVLIMIALDIWCGWCNVSITEAFETLDEYNWLQFIEALNVLGEANVF